MLRKDRKEQKEQKEHKREREQKIEKSRYNRWYGRVKIEGTPEYLKKAGGRADKEG